MNKKIFILFVSVILSLYLFAIDEDKPDNEDSKVIGAYSVNKEIYINELGTSEKKSITKGYHDYKPSWSKSGLRLVFFRVIQYTNEIATWETAICVINTDGTGFKEVTDGKFHDFNPTWTRDGSEKIILNRCKFNTKLKYLQWFVYMTSADSNPGEEILISDPNQSEYAHTCTKDGRILIASGRGSSGYENGYYMFTPDSGKTGKYERIKFNYNINGIPLRVSISPDESKISYELDLDYNTWTYDNHSLVVSDFNINTLTLSNPVIFKEGKKSILDLYPRWIKDGSAIVYHSNITGKCQLYMYKLSDKSTTKMSLNNNMDYEFFCGEETPK